MLPIHKLKDARKEAKVSKLQAGKQIDKHVDSITRIEEGDILGQLEELGRLYGAHICILTEQEYGILSGIVPFLGKIGVKEGEKGE